MDIKEFLSRCKKGIKNWPENLRNAILNYQEGYRKGVEKFGVWWKVFHWSMWGFVLVFFVTAALVLIFYVPRLQMLRR